MRVSDTPMYVIAFLFTLTLTVFLARSIIPFLKSCAKQPIYTDGPSWHVSKSGTPTMGGVSFLVSISLTLLLCSLYKYLMGEGEEALSLIICVVYAALNAAVGILDDVTKLKRKENAGLTPRAKLVLQLILSALFLLARSALLHEKALSLFPIQLSDSRFFYYAVSLIILVGITNCANLTDGIDGLSSSVAFSVGIALFYCYYRVSDNVSFISSALVGGAIAFLIFNLNPAKVFMGDTGSLFLGSLIAAVGFEAGSPMISVISGGVYVIEGVSVILQVIYYKATKKRLFKMAPIHHHLEKCGWDENRICIVAIILTLLMSSAVLICVRR